MFCIVIAVQVISSLQAYMQSLKKIIKPAIEVELAFTNILLYVDK